MATLTPIRITESGVNSSLSTCTDVGDDFVNTGQEFIHIHNDHASSAYSIKILVTKQTIKNAQYGTVSKSHVYDQVSAGNSIYIGPFLQSAFNNASTNKVSIFYKALGTGTTDSTFNALDNIAGAHELKIEVLYI
jgi:hypothetical protein